MNSLITTYLFRCGVVSPDGRVEKGDFACIFWSFVLRPDGSLDARLPTLANSIQWLYPYVSRDSEFVLINDTEPDNLKKVPFDANSISDTVAALNRLRDRQEGEPISVYVVLPGCKGFQLHGSPSQLKVVTSPVIRREKVKSFTRKRIFNTFPSFASKSWSLFPTSKTKASKESGPVLLSMVSLAAGETLTMSCDQNSNLTFNDLL